MQKSILKGWRFQARITSFSRLTLVVLTLTFLFAFPAGVPAYTPKTFDGELPAVAERIIELNETRALALKMYSDLRVAGADISSEVQNAYSVSLGDMDNDGDLDLVMGNADFPAGGAINRIYLNNGTADPFRGTKCANISEDARNTYSLVAGDVDKDGDLDLIAGNFGINRLYLNNGSFDPFRGVEGVDISKDEAFTLTLALGDVDGDGDEDLVAGNFGAPNRLYLNNGTSDPFSGSTGEDISGDWQLTVSLALGDIDGDGNLDIVVGNYGKNRLYLNNGSSKPFTNIKGRDITDDEHFTFSVALGDIDGDGNLDVVAGNGMTSGEGEPNRLYLNNGTGKPFEDIVGANISEDRHVTKSVCIGDIDGDGSLDVIAGNMGSDRLYPNNGKPDPFMGVEGLNIGDEFSTVSVALGDVDGDGDLDIVAGNLGTSRLYFNLTKNSISNGKKRTGKIYSRLVQNTPMLVRRNGLDCHLPYSG